MGKNTYIIVGPLRIDDLSAVHPDIIQGYPSPTAVAGIGYKMLLDLAEDLDVDGLTHEGTAVVVHQHSMLEGHPKNPVAGTDATKGAPIVDEYRARAELSFVISVGGLEVNDNDVIAAIFKRLPALFFSGGKVFPKSFDIKKQVKIATDATLIDTLKAHRSGFVLFDRHDLLELELSSGEFDTLDALLNCLEFRPVSEENEIVGQETKATDRPQSVRKYAGWLVPLLVGFQGIERSQKRSHTRTPDGLNDHVYAESLYSLGEYKSLASILASEDNEVLEGSFWKHNYLPASETFVVIGNS